VVAAILERDPAAVVHESGVQLSDGGFLSNTARADEWLRAPPEAVSQ